MSAILSLRLVASERFRGRQVIYVTDFEAY